MKLDVFHVGGFKKKTVGRSEGQKVRERFRDTHEIATLDKFYLYHTPEILRCTGRKISPEEQSQGKRENKAQRNVEDMCGN